MPWFAELRLNVNGNEGWHVENRPRHSSPPQVQQSARERERRVPPLCPSCVSLQADSGNFPTLVSFSFLNEGPRRPWGLGSPNCAERSTFHTQLLFVFLRSQRFSAGFCATVIVYLGYMQAKLLRIQNFFFLLEIHNSEIRGKWMIGWWANNTEKQKKAFEE